MNVTLEHLGPCKKLLRVVVETDAVEAVFDTVTKDYVKYARLPGFRQGKAPRHLVAKAFDDLALLNVWLSALTGRSRLLINTEPAGPRLWGCWCVRLF